MIYDVVIIGAGAGGMTAAIYAKRAGYNVLIIEKNFMAGGQMLNTQDIENYPSYDSISGFELSERMFSQVVNLDVEIITDEVVNIIDGDVKTIDLASGKAIQTSTIIIATGTRHKELDVLRGHDNISYCATCDGAFYKDKRVLVVGGGNSAFEDALYLSNIAEQVVIVQRGDSFKADYILRKSVGKTSNILIKTNCELREYRDGVATIIDKTINLPFQVNADGIFVAIGTIPNTENFKKLGILHYDGYIPTDSSMESLVSGIYAIGDVRSNSTRQIVTAVGDGCVAVKALSKYLQ